MWQLWQLIGLIGSGISLVFGAVLPRTLRCAAALLQFQVQRAAFSVQWQLVCAALDAVPPNGASVA